MKTLILIVALLLLSACAGPMGATGAQGPKGDPGTSCTAAQAVDGSGALVSCGDVHAFIHNGTDGTNGTNGQDATPVTMVQFCPNIQGHYGSFPEFGFNLGGKVYGVYSTGSTAFLAQLYPGAYTTTSNGSNCNFSIDATGAVH